MRKALRLAAGLAIAAAAVLAAPAARAAPVIQPGSSIMLGDAYCTLNWIYDGTGPRAGTVYAGTAGHCTDGVGEEVQLSTMSLGAAIQRIGTVAYISRRLDFALIRLDAGVLAQVDPALAGHPDIPTGVSTTATARVGDLIQFSGHGIVFDLTAVTQQERVGVLGFVSEDQQYVYGGVTPGDSGGPVADVSDGNKALGIVDTVGVALTPSPQAGEGGVAMEGLLNDAAANGFPVSLRTVG